MQTENYLVEARKTALYRSPEERIRQTSLGFAEEAGELIGKIKRFYRDHDEKFSTEWREGFVKEAGDVMWYLTILLDAFGITLDEVLLKNVEKLRDRQARGVIRGSGDSR